MKHASLEKMVIIITGKRLYDQVSRGHPGPATFIMAEETEPLAKILISYSGAIVLLDLSLFNNDPTHPTLRNVFKHATDQHIIVLSSEQDQALWYEFLQQGAQGFCQLSIADELLTKAIQTVKNGELWVGRQFVSYLMSRHLAIDVRKNEVSSVHAPINSNLTPREDEIAQHVAQGKCDKRIARDLNISPNTVKNHLGNIFKKLQISDRLHLALIYQGVISH